MTSLGKTTFRGPWLVALAVLALHLACRGGYGFFRDELYFIACGRHLAWGYVDQPPLIALVSRIALSLSFGSLTLYRLPANVAHVATVLVAARLAQQSPGNEMIQRSDGRANRRRRQFGVASPGDLSSISCTAA